MIILGIDPGQKTGLAIYRDGKLVSLETIAPVDIIDFIKNSCANRIIFEDSRLQSVVWSRGTNAAAASKIARNVGQIDAWCSLIVAACEKEQIMCLGVSPKGKGEKMNADRFEAFTGWTGSSNQHERDAAMVAWPYRRNK
jgi:hypothetical protein